jgi:effector-binding domain-containing protein
MVDIELLEVPTETVAEVRSKVPMTQMTEFFGPAFDRVMRAVPEAGGRVSGPPFGWYRGVPTDVVDVSAGFPVSGDVHVPDGGVVVEERPGGRAVVAVHVGPYDTIEVTYAAVMSWMKEHSLEAREDMWEEYLSPPTGDPSTWRTRIVMPVR